MSLSVEDLKHLDDVGFLASMTMVLMGNYSQTGHFGGPLAYTPANVVLHLGGAENGGLAYDIREPKHPLTDKYLLAGGHCAPTNYSLWMVLYEAMARQHQTSGDNRFSVDPRVAILPIDALGFRRSPDAVEGLLEKNSLQNESLFEQHKLRGIRALMGHCESTDATNDINGGPSGVGVANGAGKALFWDKVQAPEDIKVIMFEGEFAFTEGHAQEIKTLALAQKVGKRLRLFLSYNNAGIDDALIGGVLDSSFESQYDLAAQFSSYAWNVFTLAQGCNYEELIKVFKKMEEWPIEDKRPMVVIAHTVKGFWPAVKEGKIDGGKQPTQLMGFKSHPYAIGMNSPYFLALAESFERRFGVEFKGIREGTPKNERERLIEFKTNIDVCLSVLDQKDGLLRHWISHRLLNIAERFHTSRSSPRWKHLLDRFGAEKNPFEDERLRVEKLPLEPQTVEVIHPDSGKKITTSIRLFETEVGKKWGARRAISEVGKWCNFVTENRWLTIAADLSNSINVEAANLTGHYDPEANPSGTRLRAGIQEAANAGTMCGIASQTLSSDPRRHSGWWGVSGTYGAFTPLMYTPLRVFSQQNQDSPFALGVVTVVAAHSGPETAADGRSHFGIFAPQVWTLFPRNQIVNLYLWDYNDVAPAYFAALQMSIERKETGIIVIHVARPDIPIADRSRFANSDVRAAAKGCYLLRDWHPDQPKHGTVLVQGCSSTFNLVSVFDQLQKEELNVRVVSVISEELFRTQSTDYQHSVMPDSQLLDCMVITTFTKRVLPLSGLGPLTEQYTLSSDFDDRWRTGGLEEDVIAESRLDPDSILKGIRRFVHDRSQRLNRLRSALSLLSEF